MSKPSLHTVNPVITELRDLPEKVSGKEKNRLLSLHARAALAHSAELSEVKGFIPRKNRKGVPAPCKGIYWSVSHTDRIVAGVVAPYPVGIDVEQIKPVPPGLEKEIATEEEWQLGSQYSEILFYRYWTAKEAVLKAVGHGLVGLDSCRVSRVDSEGELQLDYNSERWMVTQLIKTGTNCLKFVGSVTVGRLGVSWHRSKAMSI